MTTDPPGIDIRELTTAEQLNHVVDLEAAVWSFSDREATPVHVMKALTLSGGLVLGAFEGNRIVGAAVGMLARHAPGAELGFHSHYAGVLAPWRSRGVGRSLKYAQRAWCSEHGLPWITWTFDPLQARNANLNLKHLGAVGVAYLRDVYGTASTTSPLFGAIATDRLLVQWDVPSSRDDAIPSPTATSCDGEGATTALQRHPVERGGEIFDGPGEPDGDLDAAVVQVAVPSDLAALLVRAPDLAHAWRAAHRATLDVYVGRGYRVTGFRDGALILTKRTHVGYG